MTSDDRFDLLINGTVEKEFPELLADLTEYGWLWVKAQIWQESRFLVQARSGAGAQGLMQLMPETAKGLGCDDPFDPVQNITAGVKYLADQYRHLAEIPNHVERLRMALASYNGGRGYINLALVIARDAEGLPGSFTLWREAGSPPGLWQQWAHLSQYLSDPHCIVQGHRPDVAQMTDYVSRIEARYQLYIAAGKAA